MSSNAFSLPEPDPAETGPYTLVGEARAKSGKADALEAVLVSLVSPTRLEDGALEYHVHRDRHDPDLFVFYEVWQSKEKLIQHLQAPYIIAFLEGRHEYLANEMTVRWLKMASAYATQSARA
jgi:quinol monooxygenase YgiN